MYSTAKFKTDKVEFPLIFPAIQIENDQWVSHIDFAMLMKFRAAQLIVYNENTQRTMEKVIRGSNEIFVTKLDGRAVNAIKKSYEDDTYIPTPLTFNIPEDAESDFYYDDENKELVINSLERFDIVDGYHRYIGACKACDNNKDLNRNMELRIVNFPEYKAQHFIFQEEQKTQMLKKDSVTFDQTNMANTIVDELTKNSRSNLKGLISRNKTIINYNDLSEFIKYLYLDNKKEQKNSVAISVKKELIENFNLLTEYDSKYVEEKYSFKQLAIVMVIFKSYQNKDKTNMCEVIDKVVEKKDLLEDKKFTYRSSKSGMIKEIEKIMKEVL